MTNHSNEYQSYFTTRDSIKIPKVFALIASLLFFLIAFTIVILIITPWVQTSAGSGRITSLTPEDRVQTVNALVSGRIKKWHVIDGAQVEKGDVLVEIQDNDPDYFQRLQSERDAIANKLKAAERAATTASINYNRQRDLFKSGLSAKKDYEDAQIKLEDYKSKVESARAELNQAETQLSRQNTQKVVAPQNGTVININASDSATFVRAGDQLATFLPENTKPAAELYINGLDAPLVNKGRDVQLIFEGWPAVQFSGWPSVAKGTFKGKVSFVDPALSPNGKIRILVTETAEDPWPSNDFLRFGTRARGWVQLNTVPLGYELWRQMNSFPPENTGANIQKEQNTDVVQKKK